MPDTTQKSRIFRNGKNADICIVGGAGHVGLPLAVLFANKGFNVIIHDLDENKMKLIRQGRMPFMEIGAEPLLEKALAAGHLELTTKSDWLNSVPIILVTIGTPVDEFQNPDYKGIKKWVDDSLAYLSDEQLIILRSTVFPGTTQWLHSYLQSKGRNTLLAYCPERIVQGHAIEELQKLPQIISATSPEALQHAGDVFRIIAPEVVELKPIEAEFAKLFANSYRYIQFAIANQFYMVCESAGVDFYNVLDGLKKNYSRCADMPSAGFAAGPCLYKDTMQLSAFSMNQFFLGHSAMLINEGMVLYIVSQLLCEEPIDKLTVGLLGMAFKPDNDDTRSSLSYKLKKILVTKAKKVLTTDPYVTTDPELLPVQEVIDRSDLLILCAPHSDYKGLNPKGKRVIDIWGFMRKWGSAVYKKDNARAKFQLQPICEVISGATLPAKKHHRKLKLQYANEV